MKDGIYSYPDGKIQRKVTLGIRMRQDRKESVAVRVECKGVKLWQRMRTRVSE